YPKRSPQAAFLSFLEPADHRTGTADQAAANSLSFFRGSTLTLVLAGFLGTSMNSPGLNGFGTFLRAGRAGFFTVLILRRPGRVNSPTPRFLMCLSIRLLSSSSTRLT